jgi:hypothetical protein
VKTVLLDLFGPGTWGTAGNLVAAVLCAAAAAAWGWLFRYRIKEWWARIHPHGDAITEIREMAAAARRIAADTYEHHTGERHPDSPPRKDSQP